MKLKNLTLLLLTFISINSCSQPKNECGFFLEPLIGFNVFLNQKKDDVLKKFDEINSFENEYDKNNFYYEVSKTVTLPNNKSSNFYGTLAFNNNNELIYFNLNLISGKNFNYYKELISILEKHDSNKINEFIYQTKNIITNDVNSNCHRGFSYGRNFEKVDLFEINFKCALK